MPAAAASTSGSAPVILVRDVCKTFRTWATPAQRLIAPALHRAGNLLAQAAPRLSDSLHAAAHRRMHVHEALHGIDFELHRGEALGIIGLNGSGKSTLLQIIAGVLPATSGRVQTHGRIAALLELGSGFNPEFTGRENVYLNGSVLGLSTQEIEARFDDIAAFADIGEFIEQPVKTCSSGMMVRLAFAVIAHVDADILVVDEALSVGDAVFVQRCMRFIRGFQENGTLLFVSHDVSTVVKLGRSAIWLHQGQVRETGETTTVAEAYLQYTQQDIYGEKIQL